MYNDDVNEIKFRLQSIKILQVFLYSFKSVDDFSLLETLLVSFFKCSSTGKVFSFSHESQQSPAHFSCHFKANEILFYLRPGNKGKKVWSPLQDNTVSFYCKTKQVTSNYTQRPTGCTTCSLDNVYVAVNFLFQLIFVFPLFQIH